MTEARFLSALLLALFLWSTSAFAQSVDQLKAEKVAKEQQLANSQADQAAVNTLLVQAQDTRETAIANIATSIAIRQQKLDEIYQLVRDIDADQETVAEKDALIPVFQAQSDNLTVQITTLLGEIAALEAQIEKLSQFQNLSTLGYDAQAIWAVRPAQLPTPKPVFSTKDGEVWTRRLVPATLGPLSTSLRTKLVSSPPVSPQRLAIVAIVENDPARMDQARDLFFSQKEAAYEYSSSTCKTAIALTYALDLIRWRSEAEFEQAFEIARSYIQGYPRVPDLGTQALVYNNDFWAYRPAMYKTLLALVAYGRPGPSGTWATQELAKIYNPVVDNDSWTYDPYLACNVLSLIGIEGNEGFGRNQNGGNGLGLYTDYYGQAIPIIWSWDQACGTDLCQRCLLFKTLARHNVPNEHTAIKNVVQVGAQYYFLLCDDPVAKWLWTSHPEYETTQHYVLFRALMDKGVAPQPPTEKWVEASNQFCYSENPADKNAFWCNVACVRMDHARFTTNDGVCELGIGKVALLREVQAKSFTDCYGGNHMYVSLTAPLGYPEAKFERMGRSYWISSLQGQPKHRPWYPEEVAKEPGYLIHKPQDLPLPANVDGHYKWTVDYSDQWQQNGQGAQTIGGVKYNGNTLTDKVNVYKTEYDLYDKTLVMTHTFNGSLMLGYVGYHFSPNLQPTYTGANSFEVSDGINKITVLLEPLDGTTLTRSEYAPYGSNESVKRVAKNIGYAASPRLQEHKCKVTITCN